MARTMKLTHARLLEMLDFDPVSGVFVWKVARSNRVKIGSRAGVLHQASGGRYIAIDNERFMAHRLAFFYVNARWPNTDVRPLDGDYDNSAIGNLEEISRVELAHRRGAIKTNTSGYAGVSRAPWGKWQAKITWNYEQISLGGNFETADEAGELYIEAERRLKTATSADECAVIVGEVRLLKRQRAAWKYLTRSHEQHSWASFEQFTAEVKQVPKLKYAMVPLDITRPIGPSNFRWALPLDTSHSTADGLVAYKRAVHEQNREFHHDKHLKKTFQISRGEFLEMSARQNHVCAICGQPETKLRGHAVRELSVDHDHVTKKIRGLLCGNCNDGIGYFGNDRPDLLRAAARYLDAYYGRTGELIVARPSSQDHTVSAAMAASPHRDWLPVATLGFGA